MLMPHQSLWLSGGESRGHFVKILLISILIIIMPNLGFSADKKLSKSKIKATTNPYPKAMKRILETVKNLNGTLKVQANIKESFVRQRGAGLQPHADIKTVETALRLMVRANSDKLKAGTMWRSYPNDKTYASHAKNAAKAFEEHVIGLKQIHTWGCTYDNKVSFSMKSYINLLTISGKMNFTERPAKPPYTKMEQAYLAKTKPGIKEATPKKDEKSAFWLDWAAAKELKYLTPIKKGSKFTSVRVIPAPKLIQTHIREAIRLWMLATAAENGLPAPKISKKRLDSMSVHISHIIAEGWKRPSRGKNCGFEEFVADITGKAAKHMLLSEPVESFKSGRSMKSAMFKRIKIKKQIP
jgi:hypothetical protein